MKDNVELAVYIETLIEDNKLYKFYKSKEWMKLRDEVMRENHYECQRCLEKGKLTRAEMVHHINEVKRRPDLALSKTYKDIYGIEHKNLIPLCNECHEKEHDRFTIEKKDRFMNEERW